MVTRSTQLQMGIDACTECANVCSETVTYCLEKGGRHADDFHLRHLLDCADICRMTASLMLRASDYSVEASELCADICQQCAEDCARFKDDEQMQQCADACRRAADFCRGMMSPELRHAA